MGIVLRTPQAVVEYFYNIMAKKDLLSKIEQGDITPKETVLKWLHNNSSWEDRITHSGQLDSCLKGQGFAFQSFIGSATNNKETIVILGIQRAKINWIKQIGGKGYLDNFQSSATSRFTTCTLSVLIAASSFMGIEVQRMVKQYIQAEREFKLTPDINTLGRTLMAEKIAELETKWNLKMSSIGRHATFSIINKLANFATEPISTTVEMIFDYLDKAVVGTPSEFKYKTARNLFDELSIIADKTILWVTTPELAIEQEVRKKIMKETTTLRKPITTVKSKISTAKKPATLAKKTNSDIKKILRK